MPAVTREYAITYGAQTVGGTTDYLIDGSSKIRISRSYERTNVSFDVIVTGTTEADFVSRCRTLEQAFRTPRQKLTLSLGGSVFFDFDPTTNTGYNANPTISKAGDSFDSGRSRRYQISIDLEEPADLSGQSGRRTSTVELQFEPGKRRIVTISGVYTALGANTARQQYEASINAYAASILSGFGGTYELVAESATADDANKNLSFTRTYEEVIFNQAPGVLDHGSIFQMRLSLAREMAHPGDSPKKRASRLRRAVATVDLWVDKSQTDLQGFYQSTVRPHVLERLQAIFGGTQAILSESSNIDVTLSRISASFTMLIRDVSGPFEFSYTIEIEDDKGLRPVAVWEEPFTKLLYQGDATRTRTITQVELTDQALAVLEDNNAPHNTFSLLPVDGEGGGWVTLHRRVSERRIDYGPISSMIRVVERTITTTQIFLKSPTGTDANILTP